MSTAEAKKTKRIYIVTNQDGAPVALVRANTKAAAVNRAVKRDYRAEVASQDELFELGQAGWRVLDMDDDEDAADTDDVTLSPNTPNTPAGQAQVEPALV